MHTTDQLIALVTTGQFDALEEAWMAVTDPAAGDGTDWTGLVKVIGAAVDAGQGELGEVLAWTAISAARESIPPERLLPFASGVLRRFDKNADLRAEAVSLYRSVYADVEGVNEVVALSGLADGSTSVRLALRRLETCLVLEPGSYLVERGGEDVAEVTAREPDRSAFTIRTPRKTVDLSAEQLVADYQVADPDDFRVLSGLRSDRLTALIESDPVTLVAGILRAHGNTLNADELKFALCPHHIAMDKWSKWWSRARAAMKRSDTIAVEGRSPVILTYHKKGRSLERDARQALEKAATAAELREVAEAYIREVKHLKAQVDPDCVRAIATRLEESITTWRTNQTANALCLALVRERELAPHLGETEGNAWCGPILAEADDVTELLGSLPDRRMLHAALDAVRTALPETWTDVYLDFLPHAPTSACETIREAVIEAGQEDRLREVVSRILEQPTEGIDAYCWLWQNPERSAELGGTDPTTMLGQIFAFLGEMGRSTMMPREQANAIKSAVRAALVADKCAVFRKAIAAADNAMGAVYKRQVERVDGLSPTLRERLLSIVSTRFPGLYVKVRIEPWEDESVIFTTNFGLNKTKAALAEIINVKMKENAIAIGDAAERGDLSENSEYKFALEERDLLQARASQISKQLDKARVMRREEIQDDHVAIGTRITLRCDGESSVRQITILGPWDADPDRGVYNYQTPLCQAVLGRRIGDEARLTLDDDEMQFTIDKIEIGLDP